MLSSAEVGTIVTALGCGIGKDEFNADKLRYHQIIIMTDADVDGSHIRTLLLTFFFRQMPELIARGHVYIAQPPLYKIAKGKQQQYLKDEPALDEYLTQAAIENASLHVNEDAPGIGGEALQALVKQHRTVMATINRLSRIYLQPALEAMVRTPVLTVDKLSDESAVSRWAESFAEVLNADRVSGSSVYEVAVKKDDERNLYLPIVKETSHGVTKDYDFKQDFFASAEYQSLIKLGEATNNLFEESGFVKRGERTKNVFTFADALDWLMSEAKRGYNIQRYKGLGEMNPDQLWETTMDPEVRRMLKVTVEDAIGADQIFTCLMGDQVEPRREFIEENALYVENLDV
jgi:DNA gyrase subunit B